VKYILGPLKLTCGQKVKTSKKTFCFSFNGPFQYPSRSKSLIVPLLFLQQNVVVVAVVVVVVVVVVVEIEML